MNAYIVVGPTKLQPRRFSSFDIAADSGVTAIVFTTSQVSVFGRDVLGGSKRQTNEASEPHSSISSRHRFALLMVLSILPRWRMMPASPSSASARLGVKRATASMSKLAKARRKFSRLRRIVSQLNPL